VEPSVDRIIRQIIDDDIVDEDEAMALIKHYDNLRFKDDLELKKWLNQHGYDINIKEHNIIITNRRIEENRKIAELETKLRRASREAKQAKEYAGLLRREQWRDSGMSNRKTSTKEYAYWIDKKPPPRPEPHGSNAIGHSGILPKLPKISPRKKQKLTWLAIVGPAIVACLLLL